MKITLRAARVNAGLTQGDVAEFLKKTKQTIVNWESGKTVIDSANFMALCKLYKMNKEYIFLTHESTLS